jgi:enoyl-CoA hydratase / 3-hydroxyacyl-CoA dehydrogenase
MNLVGDPVLADEAYEIGLVNRVVADHELLDVALGWARKLAGQAPLAIAQIKRVSGAGLPLDEGIEAEKRAFASAFQSADGKEGIAACLGKRAPSFEGR